ncbi:MAG: undecaprenyldiphospho-muramoylpentapeptide beta-N-acetylglucosaminyltransferase [Proteobacteria bacterium]|nr:MAG: undecaprenyldiphospho-muramoylpentapeptide beta-N-acetylglucosaminyltransferase [Pseudomonadota bacterium]
MEELEAVSDRRSQPNAARANEPARTRWVVAGGGTGGHVTMALALGEEIARSGDEVLFVGSARGLEGKLVPQAGFELIQLPAQPLLGQRLAARVAGATALAAASARAVALLRRRRSDVVISVGGYAAAPAAAAAVLLRLPLVLVEPNAIPGRTNRAVARFAARVFTAFEAALPAFAATLGNERVAATGAPLRRGLLDEFAAAPPRRRPAPPYRLLVVGGSQGARQLNEGMLEALRHLDANEIEVFHQTGAADRERVAAGYAQAGFRAEVVDFEPNLPARYAWADIGLCRAGALTVAELALAGLPSLLVPYPHAADDHQRANARALADHGAARVLDPSGFDGKRIADALGALFERPEALLEMGAAARALARPDAAAAIVRTSRALAARGDD